MNAEELAKILDELGERLGPTGEYVFSLAVRQVTLEGWFLFVPLVFIGLVFLATAIGIVVAWLRDKISASSESDAFFVAALCGIMGVLFWFISHMSLIKILNPEWAALEKILEKVIGN